MSSNMELSVEQRQMDLLIELFCETERRRFLIFTSRFAHVFGGIGSIDLVSKDGVGGGKSVKPANVFLNMRKLLDTVFDGSLAIVGLFPNRYILALTALRYCQKIYELRITELDERHAIVMVSLWDLRNPFNGLVSGANLLKLINRKFKDANRGLLTPTELTTILGDLHDLRCIRLNPNGTIEPKEKIKGTKV